MAITTLVSAASPHAVVVMGVCGAGKTEIGRRLAGHFMPASLLDSQLALLERPAADERPIVVDVASPPESIVREMLARLDGSA